MIRESIILFVLPALAILLFLFSLPKNFKLNALFRHWGFTKPKSVWLLGYRVGGFFFLGILPLIGLQRLNLAKLSHFGIGFGIWELTLFFSLFFVALFVSLLIRISRSQQHLSHYPPWREFPWSREIKVLNFASWFLYLLGYEIFFRGVLLFWSFHVFGYAWAITISVLVYTLAHLHKHKIEIWGSIPLGILYGVVCLESQSFFPAFVGHFAMAWFNDWICLRRKTSSTLSRSEMVQQ